MRALLAGTRGWLVSSTILFSYSLLAGNAFAAQETRPLNLKPSAYLKVPSNGSGLILATSGRLGHSAGSGRGRFPADGEGISCVPYARQISGIMVVGNAWQWWNKAQGTYARGDQPEPGSVLNFRSNGHMRLGHVAVVTRVVNAREIIVDHANWPIGGVYGRVSHNVSVVDVSEANNWSAVRVELGRSNDFGSIYPTYGFIYNRPDTGNVVASVTRPAPQPAINEVTLDFRPVAERPWRTVEEVAEAPDAARIRIDLNIPSAATRFGH